jgi:hypothetical protein
VRYTLQVRACVSFALRLLAAPWCPYYGRHIERRGDCGGGGGGGGGSDAATL